MVSPSSQPVALVTGAGSGIGLAAATMLAGEGYRVALAGRDERKLTRAVEQILAGASTTTGPESVLVAPADVSTPEGCVAMVEATVGAWGRLDALINNAGWSPLASIAEVDAQTARRVFEVNALAPVWATQAAWAYLCRREPQPPIGRAPTGPSGGCVVNVSSMASADPFPGLGVYGAAKAAVNTLTRAIALEGRVAGLRAFAVAPGAVETGLLRSLFPASTLPPERCLQPDDVARVILGCVLGAYDSQNGETIFLPSP